MTSIRTKSLVAAAVILTALGGTARAAGTEGNPGYLFDERGKVVVNSYGECWKTRWWKPEYAIEECDPQYFAKAEPAPVVEGVILDANTYFDFDRDTLRPEGREKLMDVVKRIEGFKRVERIAITGHTDPIGSDQYNQDLSQRRAASVKEYLVMHGINANLITTEGMGESRLIATCPRTSGRERIACFQPNRRVEIEISGVK